MKALSFRRMALLCFTGATVSLGAVAAQPLSGDELKAAFSGNTIYITHRNGNHQIAYYRPNGTGKTVGRTTKEFTWEIKGKTLCHDTSTQRKCYYVTKFGGGYDVESEDREWNPYYEIKIGNTENY